MNSRRSLPPLLSSCAALLVLCAGATARADAPTSSATFHSASLYWNPSDADASREVQVRFRETGGEWRDGLAMPHNSVRAEDEVAVYRGSLVHLSPDTEYEVELTLEGSSELARMTLRTRSESLPEGEVVRPDPADGSIVIDASGTAEAYRVYDGGGQVFDLSREGAHNIDVRANYVILRNFVLRGAREDAVRIRSQHHVVVEDSDISAWGSLRGPRSIDVDDLRIGRGVWGHTNAGVRALEPGAHHIVVQRNRIHDPTFRSNTWEEPNCRTRVVSDYTTCNGHPYGPVSVYLSNTTGHNVIRYNEIFGGEEHYFGDVIGGDLSDSDIYGNYIANGWDDGLEIEGVVRNLRVWNNYIDHCYMMIANAAVEIGPLYLYRNLIGVSERELGGAPGAFVKMGTQNRDPDTDPTQGRYLMRGFTYLFHNTLTNPGNRGSWGPGLRNRPMRYVVGRNNILFVPSSVENSIAVARSSVPHVEVDFDYDLYNRAVPEGSQANGFMGEPDFATGSFARATLEADFRLEAGSLGHDTGARIPNFSDAFVGAGPDVGAHEAAGVLRFGVEGAEATLPGCDNGMCGALCDQPCSTACAGSPVTAFRSSFEVDGVASEPVAFPPIQLESGSARAEVVLAWGSDALFVRAVVQDDDVRAHVAAGEEGQAWLDDGIEVFVDPDQSGGDFGDDDLQIIVNALGGSHASRPVEFESATRLDATINDEVGDVGFTIELAIPWEALRPPDGGPTLGLNVALNNRGRPDDGTPRGGANSARDWAELDSFADPAQWCALVLSASSGPPDGGMADGGGVDAGRMDAGGDASAAEDAGVPVEAMPGCGCSTATGTSVPLAWGFGALLLWLGFRRRDSARGRRAA
ncbi:MAG: sugar-binding protein [Sandaracinaceae bacterium]